MRIPAALIVFAALLAPVARGAESFDDAMKRAAAEYGDKTAKAAGELTGARKRIADEKAPLLQRIRSYEDRIVTAQSQIERMETGQEDAAEQRRKLLLDIESVRRNAAYMTTLAHDGLSAFKDGLAPGEAQILSDRVAGIGQRLDATADVPSGKAAVETAEFLLERTRLALGGYAADGAALAADSTKVVKGTFAFVGPDTFFLPAGGGGAGTARMREGSAYPIVYPLPGWNTGEAAAFFRGTQGTMMADASGGKALRLKETQGTLLEHIRKGGLVAYAIIGVGLVALLMILQKIRDVSGLAADPPLAVRAFLSQVAEGSGEKARLALASLHGPTRELFEAGLQNQARPKEILEQLLQSVLLRQRLHFERRLPLLAVIATAAPLMGLLGTVVGMVKTFALITVFGTGNAGKLASGISQVLVATELGLIVAIPTLIVHGFLANRIQKNLSVLENDALDFVIAAETARRAREGAAR